jgi:GxxExxY protein
MTNIVNILVKNELFSDSNLRNHSPKIPVFDLYFCKIMIKNEYPESELTGKIIGCAMEVHRILGNGFQEVVYQRSLELEMAAQGLSFAREQEMPVLYKNTQVSTRRVDFFVEGKILVELKAIIRLEDVHLAQAINYLEAFDMELGLLINFGAPSLQFRRLMRSSKKRT